MLGPRDVVIVIPSAVWQVVADDSCCRPVIPEH